MNLRSVPAEVGAQGRVPEAAKPTTVKSADRVLHILEMLSSESGGLSFGDVCVRLGLPKSSAHALLTTLVARRFVEQDKESQRYSIGLKVWALAQRAGGTLADLAGLADPYLARIRDQLNEVVQLAILDGTDNVYIARKDANQSLTLVSQVGVRLPAYATGLGKALLAGLALDDLRRRFVDYTFVSYTSRTVKNFDELLASLDDVRARGYATDQGEYTGGVSCTAMPIRDSRRQVVAAISVSAPVVRLTPALGERVHLALREAAVDMSSRLGCPREPPSAWYADDQVRLRLPGVL